MSPAALTLRSDRQKLQKGSGKGPGEHLTYNRESEGLRGKQLTQAANQKGAPASQGRAVLATRLSGEAEWTRVSVSEAPLHLAHGGKEGLAGWQEGSQPGRKNLHPTLPTRSGAACVGAEAENKLLNHHCHVEVHTNTPTHLSSLRVPASLPQGLYTCLACSPLYLLPIQSSDLGSTVTSRRHTFLAKCLARNPGLRNSPWNE